MTEAAAVIAWLGGALIVLADRRRGLAGGLAVMAVGLGVLAVEGGQQLGGVALLAGGAIAAVLRFRSGPGGWGLLQPGSTPRMILTVVVGLLALWVGASVTSGDGASLRVASLACLGLMAARILEGADRAVALSAVSGLALALGAAAGLAEGGSESAAYVIAGLIAAGVAALPVAEPRAA